MAATRTRLVFEASQNAFTLIESSHDYFAGAEIALHHLRWAMLGYRTANPGVSQAEFASHFSAGPGTEPANAVTLLDRDWNEVQELQRRLRLMNLVSTYEAWCRSLADAIGLDATRTTSLDLHLQSRVEPNRLEAIIGPSEALMAPVVSECRRHRHNRDTQVAELRLAYRAFKETRNAVTHNGGVVDDRTKAAIDAYYGVRARWTGISSEFPTLPRRAVGDAVILSSRGLIGLASILQMMIATFDARVADSALGLAELKRRWQRSPNYRRAYRQDPGGEHSFRRTWNTSGLPSLAGDNRLFQHFRQEGLVT